MRHEEAVDIRHNGGIPAGLPPGTKVAHKTGSITKIAHDAGLVFRPDGSFVSELVTSVGDSGAAALVVAVGADAPVDAVPEDARGLGEELPDEPERR